MGAGGAADSWLTISCYGAGGGCAGVGAGGAAAAPWYTEPPYTRAGDPAGASHQGATHIPQVL